MTTVRQLKINGRDYDWPALPVVGVCFDGCDPEYIDSASRHGLIPTIEKMSRDGFAQSALAAMPTFTNPNNVSIVCGAPPRTHGVSGNFYIDRETGEDVMMVDAAPVRAPTLLSVFSQAGAKVAAVTAKDKLRKALGKGLQGVCFSAEKAAAANQAENGIDGVEAFVGRSAPDQYSADLSLFVLDAGIRLLETWRPDISYLSLSDYVQHKYAPDQPEALQFMADVDRRFAAILATGARLGIVADHGMSDMARADGEAHVVYLGDILDTEFGRGACRVICPITDPFVRHHGAMGGFVRVHIVAEGLSRETLLDRIRAVPGIALAMAREEACLRFELPEDREGDIAVIAAKGVALGSRQQEHDLSQLSGKRLRSHGSLCEQVVPFIVSTPIEKGNSGILRNYDLFAALLNRRA